MEQAFAVVLGLGAVAVSPFVPGLRPVARKVVAGEHWKDLVAEARAEREAAAAARETAAELDAETITISKP